MPTETWRDAANLSIEAIRAAGASNLVLVPGNSWTSASSWTADWYGTSNGIAMLDIVDSGSNYAFEVHQYLDPDESGTSDTCVSSTIGSERVAAFTSWARANGYRAFLGEFGAAPNATCLAAIDDLLGSLGNDDDVWLGWSIWAAGPWWPDDYTKSLQPAGGEDKPHLATLTPYL